MKKKSRIAKTIIQFTLFDEPQVIKVTSEMVGVKVKGKSAPNVLPKKRNRKPRKKL